MHDSPGTSIYTIVLLRHGESVGNAEGVVQGQSDFELNEIGRAQARALAERWRAEGLRFDAIVSSPLARSRQTAGIIADALGAPVEHDPLWMERNHGLLDGLHPAEGARRWARPAFLHPYQPIGESGESQWELYLRAGRALDRLMRRPPGCYLVVSHGGILTLTLYAILGIVPQANLQGPRFRFLNAAFALLYYHPENHCWVLERLNDRAHWKEAGEA